MSCLDPMHGFIIGKKNNDKNDIIITSKKIDHVEIKNNKIIYCNSYETRTDGKVFRDYIDIPCGKCLSCRLDKAKEWTARVLMEAGEYEKNCFVTLTYDNINIPRTLYGTLETGEVCGDAYTLRRRDLQLFFKRLRKALGKDKIRYFGCGEYGDTTARPHYHLVLFGYMPDDLKYYAKSGSNVLYTSDFLSSIWKNGYVVVGDLSSKSAGYVARYTTKKLYGNDADYYQNCNLVPPFLCCSLKPAIGYTYLKKNLLKIFEQNCIILSTDEGGKIYPIPRIAYNMLHKEYPDVYDDYIAHLAQKNKVDRQNFKRLTKQDYYDNLEIKLRSLEARTSSLVRNQI